MSVQASIDQRPDRQVHQVIVQHWCEQVESGPIRSATCAGAEANPSSMVASATSKFTVTAAAAALRRALSMAVAEQSIPVTE